ncbi:hypothetical protein HRU45_03165 [Candidatus Dependentiae bacterium]|nr:hypothetical protein [Candidatus Dependentiae bacterium]
MSDTDFCHNQEPLIGLFDKNSDELHVGLNKKNKKNPRSNFEKYVNTLVKYICNGEIINREKKKKRYLMIKQ